MRVRHISHSSRGARAGVTAVVALALTLSTAVSAPAVSAAPDAPAPDFVVPDRTYTTANLGQDLDVGDFNGDGEMDAILANLGPDAFNGGVTVFLGDGDGNLGAPIDTPLGMQIGGQDIGLADFNEDGKLDAVVQTGSTGGAGTIMVLLGDGAGGFTIGQQLSGGNGHVVAGELTGDGKADIMFAYENGAATLKFYQGKGDGTFMSVVNLERHWDAYELELADMNSDGLLDVVGTSGPFWVMLNQGGGNFAAQVTTDCSILCIFDFTLADFDGDGTLDVAGSTASEGTIKIAHGNGDGTFVLGETYDDISFATGPITSGDFTGDGNADIITANEYASESRIVLLMKGNGDGTFGGSSYWTTGNEDPTPVDLNDDGKLDLVAYSPDPGLVYATLNAGNGKFKAPRDIPADVLREAVTADINADGNPDVVTMAMGYDGAGYAGRTSTYFGKGKGEFKAPVSTTVPAPDLDYGDEIGQIQLADVDEDGQLDLVAGFVHLFPKVPANVWVLKGTAKGKFKNLTRLATGGNWTSNPSIGVGDVNGDGHVDIVAHADSTLATLLGEGNGTFKPAINSGSSSSRLEGVNLADFTGDGKLDAVAIIDTSTEHVGSGVIRFQRGNGDGTFTLVQSVNIDGGPGSPGLVADLNGDDRLDLVVAGTRRQHSGRSGMRVMLNTGTASPLGTPVYYPSPDFPMGDLDPSDVDLDGDVDIVGSTIDALMVAINNGSGTLTGPAEFIIPYPSGERAVADFTGDGKPDVWNANATDRSLYSVYKNRTRS